MRIVIVSELLRPPYDEGFKKTANEIAQVLGNDHEVHIIQGGSEHDNHLRGARSGFLWCFAATRRARTQKPHALLYIPAASLSFGAFIRSRLLAWRLPGTTVRAILGLQRRTLRPWQIPFLRCIKPDLALMQTTAEQDYFQALGLRSALLPSGVDLSRFAPCDDDRKAALRAKHGIATDKRVLLHVGHLKLDRNLEPLLAVQRHPDWQVVIVASSSTEPDLLLRESLLQAGVRIEDGYIDAIEDYYQLSDGYVFPVREANSAISFPLSVLEAMACNLPIVTTPFGRLPEAFDKVPCLHFWDGTSDLLPLVQAAAAGHCDTRNAALQYDWKNVAATLIQELRLAALNNGALICLTGADGAGKSTQLDKLDRALQVRDIHVRRAWCRWKPFFVRPLMALAKGSLFRKTSVKNYNVSTAEGQKFEDWQRTKKGVFRSKPIRNAYLAAAILDYLLQIWFKLGPALLRNRTVLADRYLCDLIVDQSINFGLSDSEMLALMNRWWTRLFPRPDLVFYLDLDEEQALARRSDIPSLDYLRERRRRYQALSHALGYIVIDAAQDIDSVHAALMAELLTRLPEATSTDSSPVNNH